MRQGLFAQASSTAAATEYAAVMGGVVWTTEATNTPWPAPGVLRHLIVDLAVAPGVGTSRTFTLRKNGANTALVVTISNTATTARLTGTDVAIAVDDLIALQVSVSGTPVTSAVRWALEFEGTTAKESVASLFFGSANAAVRYGGLFVATGSTSTTAANARNVVAAAGTLTGMRLVVSLAPGVGNGYTVYINKNGVRQDGSGGTVNTACALIGTGTTGSATYSLPLAAGDVVYTEWVPSGGFTARSWRYGVSFLATTDGESQVCGTTGSTNLSTTATGYSLIPSMLGGGGSATEAAFAGRMIGGVTAFGLSGMQLLVGTAPGASKSRTLDLRNNAASVGPTVTISGTATTGSDLVNSATIADGDLWNWRSVPTSTPAASIAHWGFIQSTAPAAVARSTPFVGPVIVS